MAFKFPFTNYHELNLTWVLEQLKKLFEDSEENVETIENYENRLSAVETELPVVEATANQAETVANAAATLAQTAKSTADTANENALTASAQAGLARQEAATAEAEAQAAQQAAQQAQATAQNFDGRITQAEADASEALQEAQSFENRVNAAINTANNAANTATIAQGIAVNANQSAAAALDAAQIADGKAEAAQDTADQNADKIGDLSDLTTTAKNNLVAAINEAAQTGGGDDTKAPLIVVNASGDVVSIKDGADDMAIRHLIATINPIQAGTGDPSPSNVRPITGRTGLSGARAGKNLLEPKFYGGLGYNIAVGSRLVTNLTDITNTVTHSGDTYTKSGSAWGIEMNMMLPLNDMFVGARLKFSGSVDPITGFRSAYYITDKDYIVKRKSDSMNEQPTWVIDVEQGDAYIFWYLNSSNAGTMIISQPQIEIGSNASSYEPYQGETISVSWATEAGTLYAGTLDVVTGKLIATYRLVLLSELTNWASLSTLSNGVMRATVPDIFGPTSAEVTTAIMDRRTALGYGPISASSVNNFAISPDGRLIVPMGSSITVEDFLTEYGNAQLCYPLATPIVYQLDPITVNTLLGDNTIYVDSGPVSADYPADTKLYIDGKVAELQALILEI